MAWQGWEVGKTRVVARVVAGLTGLEGVVEGANGRLAAREGRKASRDLGGRGMAMMVRD